MIMMEINAPTYPARPINGGPLEKALPKRGLWAWEPKYNEWRTLIHVPTGTMWNRHLAPLSIADKFKEALRQLRSTGLVWVDAGAMERRHDLGRGTIIVFDYVPMVGDELQNLPYVERRRILCSLLGIHRWFGPIPDDTAILTGTHTFDEGDAGTVMELWQGLKQFNKRIGVEFYEGLVAKRLNSGYPVQLRSPTVETHLWMKHRFI